MEVLCSCCSFLVTHCVQFSISQTLTAADLRDPEISRLIASKMKEFHDLNMPGPKNTILWDRIRCSLLFSLLSLSFYV